MQAMKVADHTQLYCWNAGRNCRKCYCYNTLCLEKDYEIFNCNLINQCPILIITFLAEMFLRNQTLLFSHLAVM